MGAGLKMRCQTNILGIARGVGFPPNQYVESPPEGRKLLLEGSFH